LNADDENVLAMTKETVAKVVTFGFQEEALLRASDEMYFYEEGKKPYLIFKWHYNGSVVPVGLKNILTRTQIYSFLAAAAVGLEMRLPMMEIIKIMENFSLPKGRTNLITGIKETQIIDDTYNSSPKAVKAALTVLTELRARRKIAVLGEMLELGSESEKLHQEIGREVFVRGIDLLITTGERARDIARGAKEAGMNDNLIFSFETPGETGRFLQDRITMGDLILIKGSQGVRMEKVVKEIMAEPEKAGELLVRQDEEWLKK
jgi:UDP-N-acetylmuramoyl-tripeptide--D-alanyl-D-alanine ligase